MYYRIGMLCFLIALIPRLDSAEQNPDRNIIAWHPEVALLESDFQKTAPELPPSDALSWTGIEFNGDCWQGEFTYQVYAIFHRDSSWLAPGNVSEQVLHHEKVHFDISEIYARKLRQALSTLTDPCRNMEVIRVKLDSVTSINQRALTLEQKKFDRQTRHGSNRKKQIEWENKISEQLAELAEYSDNPLP